MSRHRNREPLETFAGCTVLIAGILLVVLVCWIVVQAQRGS
jgi:hypothetical protein